jgi:hypothetical protein
MAVLNRTVGILILALVVGVSACSDGDDGTGLDPTEFEIVVISGSGQSGVTGTVLSDALVVAVRARASGAGEKGVSVSWTVTQGSGEPTRRTSVTDADGRASTRIELGGVAGDLQVWASVSGLDPVFFASLTALPAPTIQSLSSASADPGDTIDVNVSDLDAGLAALVLFDGVEGEIVDRQDGDPAVLGTIVPAPVGVCSGNQAVEVRIRADGYTSPSINLNVSVPADPFEVGQVLVIEGTADVACALLPADGGNAKYLLVALSAEFETDGQFQVTLGGSSIAFAAAGDGQMSPASSFNSRLRALEQQLAARGVTPSRASSGARLFAQPDVGDTRLFWVINDIDALPDLGEEDFDRVTATLKFVGVHTLLYMDDAAPVPGLTDADIETLGELYDRVLYQTDVDFFGEPSDIDSNGRVMVLLSPTVNGLTPPGSQGIVVGFFFGLDLFDPNTPNCPECDFSNDGELFYGLVPDPHGDFGDVRSRDRVLDVLPGVMIHETEHMINFNHKVFVNNRTDLEELWLSEGMAHMAEELGGDAADAGGDTDVANELYAINFGRADAYLQAPDTSSLTVVSGNGTLGERGAAWLFLRWLADQYGDFIFRELAQAFENGVENIEDRTGETFFRLFADWSVAVWADDLNIPGLADRYQFPKWQLRSILVEDGPGDVYILQPLQQTFAEFRATSITEFLAGSSPYYVELDADGDMTDLQLELDTAAAAGLAILRYE